MILWHQFGSTGAAATCTGSLACAKRAPDVKPVPAMVAGLFSARLFVETKVGQVFDTLRGKIDG